MKSKVMFDKIKKINNKFIMKPTILQQQNQVVYQAKDKANLFPSYFMRSFNVPVPSMRCNNNMFMQVQAAN